MGWELKVKENWEGDTVRLTFELYQDGVLRKKWGQVVQAEQVKAAVEVAKRMAKEFSQNYGKTQEYSISLDEEENAQGGEA